MPEERRKERPEAWNLLGIYAALSDQNWAQVLAEFEGSQFSSFKKALTEVAVEKLGPIGAEMKRLQQDAAYVDGILKEGAERANAIALPILREVQEILLELLK